MPERFGRVVAPIYRALGEGFLEHSGSGVLLCVLNAEPVASYWVATARHVLDDAKGAILPCKVQPRAKVLSGKGVTVDQDLTDVGIAPLTNADRDVLVANGYSFLPMSEETVRVGTPHSGDCILSGYPVGSVELDGDAMSISIATLHAKTNFVPFNVPGRLAANFGGFESDYTRRPIQTPDPHGMSGGAMWHIEGDTMRLAGINTDWDPTRELIIGTTVRAILRAIVWKLSQTPNLD